MTAGPADPARGALRIVSARRTGQLAASLETPADAAAAYAVQHGVLAGLGDPGGVWKMALLGGVSREAAILPRAALHRSGAVLPMAAHSAIEVETALILAGDPGPEASVAAIAEIRLAFELVASRLPPDAPPLARMADGFSSAGVVLGSRIDAPITALPDRLGINLILDGTAADTHETAAPMGDALDFLGWLSGHARRHGHPLKRGDVVITGARIGPLPLGSTRQARAEAMGATVEISILPAA